VSPERPSGAAAPAPDSVVVTGLGACCPLGLDTASLWEAVVAGRHSLAPLLRFPSPGGGPRVAASVFDEPTLASLCAAAPVGADPCIGAALAAAREALRQAGLQLGSRSRSGAAPRLVLVLGTSGGGGVRWADFDAAAPDDRAARRAALRELGVSAQGRALAEALGLAGAVPALTVSTACASGAHAIGLARDLVELGLCDVALAGGCDVVNQPALLGFVALGATGPEPCAPFSEPAGMSLGEGAGFLVLELATHAASRGAPALAALLGWGSSSDAFHDTAPEPSGAGIRRAIGRALRDAGLSPQEIGYVNAHGTGTAANDAAETLGLRAALPEGVPASSSKAQIGHTLGAAGALEAVLTALALRDSVLPPTLRFGRPRALSPKDPVAGPRARPAPGLRAALSQSCAFGGINAVLALAQPVHPARRRPAQRAVALAGLAGLDGPRSSARDLAQLRTVLPPGPLDPTAAMLLDAAARAADDAGLHWDESLADVRGLVAGVADGPLSSTERFSRSRGHLLPGSASGLAFARMVPSAALGSVSRALQLRGPCQVLASGPGSGVLALLSAAWTLAGDPELDAMFAVAADESGTVSAARHELGECEGPPPSAGGAAVLLRAAATCPGAPLLAAWALGGADELERVLAEARGDTEPDRVVGTGGGDGGGPRASSALDAVAEGARSIRDGEARTVLLGCRSPHWGAAALRIERAQPPPADCVGGEHATTGAPSVPLRTCRPQGSG
jgi:3-oxoacyl-[acyl-carrier-protein] synthase II